MRLEKFELNSIKELALKTFGKKSRVYIFGSRVDDNARGGDIDIYIDSEEKDNLFRKKIEYLVELKMTIGDQKIDLVISKDKSLLIEKQALKKGIEI